MKCIICNQRPARLGNFCAPCGHKIAADKRQRALRTEPVRFLTYKGHVVGLYRNAAGKLIPRLLKRDPDNLPKTRTLDLNRYLNGFSREEIKRFKASVLQCAHA